MAKRETELEGRWGKRVGGWINRFAAEPQSIAAWGIGAKGEELLAEALLAVPGLIALHDRRVRGTKGNIDHIVIAPAGVVVVDAKHYEGMIALRNYGWFLRPDWRLTVNRRDKSKLARDMGWPGRRSRSSSRRRRLFGRPSPRTARMPGRTSVTTGGGE